MVVKELIELLQTMPQDALVITTIYSDYAEVERDHISLKVPKDGEGLIVHHGHVMHLEKNWWPKPLGERPENPKFITAVHFAGN